MTTPNIEKFCAEGYYECKQCNHVTQEPETHISTNAEHHFKLCPKCRSHRMKFHEGLGLFKKPFNPGNGEPRRAYREGLPD